MEKKLQAAVRILAQFSRLAALETEPGEVLSLLAQTAIAQTPAKASVVLEMKPSGGFCVVAEENAAALAGVEVELDGIGPQLAERLLRQLGEGPRSHAQIFSLLAGGDMFGMLVLFFSEGRELPPEGEELMTGLVDLAATALGRSFQRNRFDSTYAELEHSRRALAHAEKLRALGQMAAGVSHDLKNIFNPLMLQLQLLKRRAGQSSETMAPTLAAMEQVLQHGLERVEKLRSFSRQAPEIERRVVASINDLVTEATELCRLRAARPKDPVQIELILGATPRILVEAAEFVGAVVNLATNALEAMPRGGRLQIETGADAASAWMRVSDSGSGIAPELQGRIFEPFFTTKGEDGTGLGLSTVYAFARRHMGSVTCESTSSSGTQFLLRIPGLPELH